MSTAQNYCDAIRKKTRLFANWEPPNPIKIGDIGSLDGTVFERKDSLTDEEIKALGSRTSKAVAYDQMIDCAREKKIGGKSSAEAGVAKGHALLEFNFKTETGVAFTTTNLTIQVADKIKELGDILKARRLRDEWDFDQYVVFQTNTAAKATIMLSEKSGSSIGFEIGAEAPVNAELVASLDASASLLTSSGVGMKWVGEGPIVPLFRLACLKRRIFRDPTIEYRSADAANSGLEENEFERHAVDDEHELLVI